MHPLEEIAKNGKRTMTPEGNRRDAMQKSDADDTKLRKMTTIQKYSRVIIYGTLYGTLGFGCTLALTAALVIPDWQDVYEAQIAAVYLALLVGSHKAFNAKPILNCRVLGSGTTFTAIGLVPAMIIHVALAEIKPGQPEHLGTLIGHGLVLGIIAFLTTSLSWIPVNIWEAHEERATSNTP